MLLFSVILALASVFLCDATDSIACEGNILDLYCTDGTIIHVLSANYGRTSIFPCLLYFGASDCKAANSTQVVSHRCNNQQKCTVDVSNGLFGDPCPYVPKYLEVNYTCNAIQEEDQVLVTCQDEIMVLVCPDGLTLDIIDADYGRGCSDLCPSPGLRTDLNCSSPNSTDIVKENCDGYNTCILNVTNDVFGDPCSGVGKYLKVNFTCSAPTTTEITTTTPKPTYPTICEDDELTINCDAGSLIDIIYAFYGRDSSTICQNLLSLPFQNCSSSNATQIVAHECDNLQTCTITASNSLFGDPCFPGTRKYLVVDWTCKTESSTACEDSDLTINCPNGTTIDVAAAVFGRIEDDICPGGIVPLPQDQNCSSPNATDISAASCDYLQSCTLNANVSVFGDPCPGTRKYLQVNYTCPFTSVTGPIKNGTVCQGQTLYLSCPGQVINVLDALFGRLTDDICPPLLPLGTICRYDATNKVRQLCEDEESCNVTASIFVFGEPCILTSKYLQVNYTCVDAPPPPPPPNNVTIACEGNLAEINCPGHDGINIVSANYGRTSLLTCPSILGLTTTCITPNATEVVRRRCENLNSCAISANNSVFGDPCFGIKKYLEIVYTCQPINANTVRACQNSTLIITCPSGTTIDVVSAKYGRTGNTYCSTPGTPSANCSTPDATSIVQEKCDDLQTCAIQANNSLFGNACGSVPSYLEVSYACLKGTPPPSTSTEYSSTEIDVLVCDNSTHSIYCPRGEINILYANYGRTSNNSCTNSSETAINCRSSNATEIVRNSCENLKLCTISANSSIYGDPCVGVSKYLEVIYRCEESQSISQSVCENQTVNLSCSRGRNIDIVSVEYGRTTNNICPIANYSSGEYCSSNNATEVVKDLCDDQQTCSVIAGNEELGNVCPTIPKYLLVVYKCLLSGITTTSTSTSTSTTSSEITTERHPTVINSTVCNNFNIQLFCANDVINIVYANWGRTSTTVCPGGNDQNTNCTQSNTTEIVRRRCENRPTCTLTASSSDFGDPCPSVSKYLDIYYYCTSLEQNTSSTCENNTLTLSCPHDTAIDIIDVVYGRLNNDVCPISNYTGTTNCSSENATTIIDDLCDDKQECTVVASSELFGDPCSQVAKYLQVNYTCLYSPSITTESGPSTNTTESGPSTNTTESGPSTNTTESGPSTNTTETPTPTPEPGPNITSSACENSSVQLFCPTGRTIDIIDVVYGRLSNQTCPTSSPITNCSASDALQIVENLCNDHQECTVGANNNVFGDPCPGVDKYLQITYSCPVHVTTITTPTTISTTPPTSTSTGTPTTPNELYVYLCEDLNININCFNGEVIDIVYANWGRTSSQICNGTNSQITNCIQPNTTEIVRRSCENRESCVLSASSDEFGDPCVGVSKYLEVVYFCTELKIDTSTVCENETLHLSCPHDTSLDIVSVVYGRLSDDVCPVEGGTNVTNCSSENATSIIDDRCDNKQECTVVASSELFGDPCSQVAKYLQVNYTCLYSPSITTESGPSTNTTESGPSTNTTESGPSTNTTESGPSTNTTESGPSTNTTETPTPTPEPGPNITSSACENSSVQLFCPTGRTIDIIDVVYGRLSNQTCPTSSPITNCSASDALQIVENLCNDHQECTVGANNNVFGDPCPEVVKYLQITYTCPVHVTTITTPTTISTTPSTSTEPPTTPDELYVYLCEDLNININCFNGEVIDIVYANWGRTSSQICNGTNSQITNCIQPNTTEIVRRSCENRESCVLSASNDEYGDPCVGVSKYLEVVYFCTELKLSTSTVCENETLHLSCPRDTSLDIVSVVYGRLSDDVCPVEGGTNVTNCSSENAASIVDDRCDNKRECTVVASSELFGDPCSQVAKYLQVSYECLYSPSTTTETPTSPPGTGSIVVNVTSCQGDVLLLSCPDDDFILIYEAIYGSTDLDVCPLVNNNTNSNCTSNATATEILSDDCDGLSSCVVNLSTDLFENPCIGTYKSLEVLYICAERETNQSIAILNETACENTELNLSCTNGEDLNIITANYGRSSSLVCPRIGQDQNTQCTLQNATRIVSESCDGHPNCSINATNSVFSDPCPGTYKYLEVEYSCPERIESVPSKKTVCQQGGTLTLTCPVGQHLQILLAIYGRLSNAICPPSGVNASTNCASPNATSVIGNRCNNAETCSINATTSAFGDPCPGTNKYLEVYYRCSRTFQCGLNEKIGCTSSCSNRMCGISSNAVECLTLICVQGCVCQEGYVRDPNTGLCIEEKYCPLPGRPCQTHEVFSLCGAGCQVSCLEPSPICTAECRSGYVCKDGFVRDTSTGRCVRSEDCPCS